MERWRDIPGYEGYYQASTLGRVRSVDRVVSWARGGQRTIKGQIVAQFCRLFGKSAIPYFCVMLWKQGYGRRVRVHQVVALTWIGPVPPDCEVRHGSAGSLVNAVWNLCYGSRHDNENDKRRDGTGLHLHVKRSDGIEFVGSKDAAKQSGCSRSNISAVCNGKRKTAGGYGWSYV